MADSQEPKQPSETPLAPVAAVRVRAKGTPDLDEIVLYSAPSAFFLWFVIAMGWLLNLLCPKIITTSAGVITRTGGILTSGACAWIFIFTLIYFLLALLYDLSLKKLILCTLVAAVVWLFAKYMEGLHHVAIIGPILNYFARLDPQFDPGTVSVICWLLFIPWAASLFEMGFNRRKKFSPNEITESHFGEGSELTDRMGLRFQTKYRDVLETLLGFGAGDVLAVDNQKRVIKRYENMVGLWFKWSNLDRILHQRETVLEDEEALEPRSDDK